MVTINFEPLEHLPYIAEHISPEERAHVEQLIAMELSNQFNNNVTNMVEHTYTIHQQDIHQQQLEAQQLQQLQRPTHDASNQPLHPMVDQILPLPTNQHIPNNLLNNMERQRYEEEDEEEDIHDGEGIDLSRYNGFISSPLEGSSSSDSQHNYNNLYTTLEYAHLQGRNLDLLRKNQAELSHLQSRHLQELEGINQELQDKLNNKRQMIDDVESTRKRRQVSEYKPVNDYFQQKWEEGISSAVELNIEAANMKQQE
ncbi:uncharacterized protein SPAPADRAFT_60427 [Spathaspora passalidarum NRRL Y-27907]|uniref:Uncharacterized protein n=1 Tax=Spathaspora passalidarum (strain NRRL Y-27907 / 11-Y1) TaxID=619300 RepID=G3AL73_SPAPN|nr:uncharacterized protein SPAPADRAFT_60427 [Spathaspora passalidarum NRRL Y-27907]EGW33115.1 hypothetical protein SPAPADRAFT_60427 [Spathaspora passalidarum NRRL Y-27907]